MRTPLRPPMSTPSSIVVLELSTLRTPLSKRSWMRRASSGESCAECSSAHRPTRSDGSSRSSDRRRWKRGSASSSDCVRCTKRPVPRGWRPFTTDPTMRPLPSSQTSFSLRSARLGNRTRNQGIGLVVLQPLGAWLRGSQPVEGGARQQRLELIQLLARRAEVEQQLAEKGVPPVP